MIGYITLVEENFTGTLFLHGKSHGFLSIFPSANPAVPHSHVAAEVETVAGLQLEPAIARVSLGASGGADSTASGGDGSEDGGNPFGWSVGASILSMMEWTRGRVPIIFLVKSTKWMRLAQSVAESQMWGKSIKSSHSIQTSWPWQPALLLAWSGDQSDAEFCSRHQAIHLLFFGKEILKDLLAAPDCKAGTNPKHPKKCLRFFGPSSQHVVYSPGGGCQLSDVCHFAGQSFQSEKGDGSEFSDTHRYERLQYLGTQPFLFFCTQFFRIPTDVEPQLRTSNHSGKTQKLPCKQDRCFVWL